MGKTIPVNMGTTAQMVSEFNPLILVEVDEDKLICTLGGVVGVFRVKRYERITTIIHEETGRRFTGRQNETGLAFFASKVMTGDG